MAESTTADAIKEIERLSQAANPVKFVRPDGFPKHVIMQIGPGETVTLIEIDAEPIDRWLTDPVEMVAFADAEATADKSAFFCDRSQIVLVIDKVKNRDKARCHLSLTRPYDVLASMAPPNQPKLLTQAEFIRLLRIDMRGCLPSDSTFLSLVRALKFENGAIVTTSQKHGRESIGKTVLQSVTGDTELPEEIRLSVPVFDQLPSGVRSNIDCAIEVLPSDGKFRLTPYPGEMVNAMNHALDSIDSILESTDNSIPVYRGIP